ncbi:MAG TPA: site-2 protease family protein [Chloroflexota bacterium]|nr:site-2 protease family protein [Chloroflexota bacterium]
MEGALRLGRIAGIEISIHATWLLAFALVTWSLAGNVFPSTYPRWGQGTYWVVGTIAALLLFVCVLLHELSHSVVARARGMPVSGITLFIFGGVTNLHGEAKRPADEFWMAIVGPLTSFVIGATAWLVLHLLPSGRTPVAGVLSYLAYVNLLLAIFNLVPGFPLDGGRVLRSLVWAITHDMRRATWIAARIGQAIACLFIVVGGILAWQGEWLNGVWLAFIGWFLLNAARASYRQVLFPPLPQQVAVAMRTPALTVPADLSIADLVSRHLLGREVRAVVVTEGGQIVGLVSVSDVQRVPPDRWLGTPLRAIMTPAASLAVVGPENSLQEAAARLEERGVNQLPVVRNGALVGMLSRADVRRFLRLDPDPTRPPDRPRNTPPAWPA